MQNCFTPVTRQLDLDGLGSWSFGSSSGTWSVATIENADWDRWGIQPYAATSKVVLNGWNDGVGDGPIDESNGGVDFVWVIYRTDTGDGGPAAVWMKFGR